MLQTNDAGRMLKFSTRLLIALLFGVSALFVAPASPSAQEPPKPEPKAQEPRPATTPPGQPAAPPAQAAQADKASQPAGAKPTGIEGATTTQDGSVFLPGVVVTVVDPAGQSVGETTSDGEGKFTIGPLKPGTYTVKAFLDGFAQALKQSVIVAAGQVADVSIDMPLAKLSEHVNVQANGTAMPLEAASTMKTASGEALEVGPISGDNYQALLPTLPGVIRGRDGHVSIAGAAPTQSSVQISSANVTDPSTGDVGFDLPNDAIDSVEVQTNPYAAEYGRFSSGVTTLNTTRGTNSWSFVPNGFVPRMYRENNNWWHITGIRSFRPRFALGGPLVKDKAFLFENVLYRYFKTPSPDLPGDQNTRFEEVKTFTRVDANASPAQTLNFTVATFPQSVDRANLSLFNQSDVASNYRQSGFNVTGSQNYIASDKTFFQSTVAVKQFGVRVFGNGGAAMEMTPDQNRGTYFNTQTRDSTTYQLVSSMTTSVKTGAVSEHLLKFGVDLLRVSYTGTSDSTPVNVVREDGTLALRETFGGPTAQSQGSTEIGLIAQDHWRISDRAMAEFGGRIDRDGVLDRFNLTPRIGGAYSLRPDGGTILRGGIGLFYERTPLNVGAFQSFEPRTVTMYGLDGLTPLGGPITYANRFAGSLRTPYSRIWNVELDHKVNDKLSFKINHLERAGHNEFIVNPVLGPMPAIELTTSGQSRYQETEFTTRFTTGDTTDTTVSYVYSRDRSDLNLFDNYFGNNRNPLIWANQYGPAPVDVPHRVLVRGSYAMPWKLRFDPLVDIHSGFPYSTLAPNQSFVGARNQAGRYPTFFSFDFSASRPVRLWKYKATVGVRMFDALRTFNPRDAWRVMGSPFFGQFGNGVLPDFQTFVELGR